MQILPGAGQRGVEPPTVLVLTSRSLTDEIRRCAAAAGYHPLVTDPRQCRRDWQSVDAVVLDLDSLAEMTSGSALSRRHGVFVVESADESSAPPELWRTAIALGAESTYRIPADEQRLVRALSALRTPSRVRGTAIAVIGGHGGAGATTLSAAIALTGARRHGASLLVDIDPLGAGADLWFALEDESGLRWEELNVDGGGVTAEALRAALPQSPAGVSVLAPRRGERKPASSSAVLAVLDAATADGTLVVIDLPRRIDGFTEAVLESVTVTVLVTTATVFGCAATRQTAAVLGRSTDRVLLAVRGPGPAGVTAREVAQAVGLPLITGARAEPRLAARLEAHPLRLAKRSPLRRMAADIVDGCAA